MCAQVEDKRNQDILRNSLDFMARIWCGPSDDVPTPEKPVIESSARSGKTETRVKKVLNVQYEEQLERLRKSSMAIRAELPTLVEKMKKVAAEDEKNG